MPIFARNRGGRIQAALRYVVACLLMSVVFLPLLEVQPASAASPDPQGTVYVADSGVDAIYVFAPGSSGNVAPERVIQGVDTDINEPGDVKVDAAGDIWVSNFFGDSITEYAPGASGDAAPICTISGSNTGLDENDDMSLEPDGTLVVGNFTDLAADGGSVEVFAPGSCGNVSPVETIEGSNAAFNYVDGVGTDAAGAIFADSSLDDAINVFPAGSTGNVAPEYNISGPDTGLGYPDDIIVGFDGKLYVTSGFGGPVNSITVYASGAKGDATPVQDITGSNTDFGLPDDLAVDSSGNIFVTDSESTLGPAVLEYASGANGDVAPSSSIVGSNTGFDEPEGVFVSGPQGPPTGASVTTSDAATTVSLGSSTFDVATVVRGDNNTSPSGSLVFKLFGPGNATCTGAPAYVSAAETVDGAGKYSSPSFTPTQLGTYSWQALYSGDANNAAITTPCNDASETVNVVAYVAPRITVVSKHFNGKAVLVKLACAAGGANCVGKVTLRYTKTVVKHHKKHRITLVLGSKHYSSISSGQSATVKVGISGTGKRLLKAHHKLATKGTVTLTQANGQQTTGATFKLTLKQPKKHK